MFEKLQTGEKIHDALRQPRTCSHPIYTQTLTGVCQAIRIFSPCFFHVFVSAEETIGRGVRHNPEWFEESANVLMPMIEEEFKVYIYRSVQDHIKEHLGGSSVFAEGSF